ncbi:hypothetical protein C0J52_18594 [Blattella germanica]|nr:hypothetical protein C0J52_18594 [Blattella germanica]
MLRNTVILLTSQSLLNRKMSLDSSTTHAMPLVLKEKSKRHLFNHMNREFLRKPEKGPFHIRYTTSSETEEVDSEAWREFQNMKRAPIERETQSYSFSITVGNKNNIQHLTLHIVDSEKMVSIEDKRAFCVFDYHVHQFVIPVQRHFRTRFGEDPPNGP